MTNVSIASAPAIAFLTKRAGVRSPATSRPVPMSAARATVVAKTPGRAPQSPSSNATTGGPDGSAAGHAAGGSPREKPGVRRPEREMDSTTTGRSLCADLFVEILDEPLVYAA